MKLRSYEKSDFSAVSQWLQNEEQHAFWCAGKFSYPLSESEFDIVLAEMAQTNVGSSIIAVSDDGIPVGFFCFSRNPENNEGMLRFVVVDPNARGQGIGSQMIQLAVQDAFAKTGVDTIALNVFIQNAPAIRCYQKAGFAPRWIEENAIQFHGQPWHRYNMVIRNV